SVLCLLIGAVGAGLGLLGFVRSLGGVLVCFGGGLVCCAVVDEHGFGLRLGLTGCGSLGRCGLGGVLLVGADVAAQVHRFAVGVDDLDLTQCHREGLIALQFGDEQVDLAVLADLLDELAGLLAVLLGGADEEFEQFVLFQVDGDLLAQRVQDQLTAQGLGGLLGDLFAVLVVLEAVLALQVLVHLGLDHAAGQREVDGFEQVVQELVPGIDGAVGLLGLGHLGAQVVAQFLHGVVLGGALGELIVHLRELLLLHGGGGHGD